MRSVLRALPIRWQITALHATILSLVLAAGAIVLWNTQRSYVFMSLEARHTTEVRALLPPDGDAKLASLLVAQQVPAPLKVTDLYRRLTDYLYPVGAAAPVSSKRLAVLDAALVRNGIPPLVQTAASEEQIRKALPAVLATLFPTGEDPALTFKKLTDFDPVLASQLMPAIERAPDAEALHSVAQELVQKVSAKERGAAVFLPDGRRIAQSRTGPVCAADVLSNQTVGAKRAEDFYAKLRPAGSFAARSTGQLTVLFPVLWQQSRPLALLQICVPTDVIDSSLNQLALSLAGGCIVVVGLATGLGVSATRRVLRPLDQVVATTRQIAAGDLQQRVGLPPGQTEISQLGAAFDAMVARLETSFLAQRRFVADAAHELRTPLTALSTSVELLHMGVAEDDPATTQRLLRHIDSELGRVIRLTNDLLTLSTLGAQPRIALHALDLSALLLDIAEQSRTMLREQTFAVHVTPELWVAGDADRLRQVVLNLLDNARKYTPRHGQITLRAVNDQQLIVVSVDDSGVGIPQSDLPHLFERFYRVDSARSRASGGSGLGLAIVQAIVAAHSGQVTIHSTPGKGTTVTIFLPRLAEASVPDPSPGAGAPTYPVTAPRRLAQD